MNPTLKNILAVIIGLIIGGVSNMFIIKISGSIIPPPNGADVTTMEGLKESLHLFEPKHFLFPFLAHAIGTLIGAFTTVKIADTNKKKMALVVGGFFLLGGVINVFILPGPIWFNAIDIIFAYIPMALIGQNLARTKN